MLRRVVVFALGNLDEDEVEGNEDGAWSGSSAVVAIAAVECVIRRRHRHRHL